jgi:hypothetical protein
MEKILTETCFGIYARVMLMQLTKELFLALKIHGLIFAKMSA